MDWFLFWLFLHIAAAIIAFGPTFVFPIVGSTVPKYPQAAHFALVLNRRIITGLVLPVGSTMLVSGLGLIITIHINLFATPFLLVAIALYLITLGIGFLHQLPVVTRLVEMTSAGPPPGAPPGPPPPVVGALLRRVRVAGMVQTALLIVIIFLMVVKPGGIH